MTAGTIRGCGKAPKKIYAEMRRIISGWIKLQNLSLWYHVFNQKLNCREVIGVGSWRKNIERANWKLEWERANVHYLMGYNEPDWDEKHPHSAHPRDAAEDWHNIETIADMFDPPLE